MRERPPRLGVGLSYQGPLRDFVREHLESFDFLEIIPDISPELPPTLDGIDLTARERRRLHAVARDAGLKVATLLHRASRLSMLANTLPRTAEALSAPRFEPLLRRFWKEHLPTNGMYVREAQSFVAFVRERVRTQGLSPGPFTELVEAELSLLEQGKSYVAPPAAQEPPPEGMALEDARPRLGAWCRVIPFRLELRALMRGAGRFEPLPDVLPLEERYLLLVSVAPGKVDPRPMDAVPGRVLRACTGEDSVRTLCEKWGCTPPLFLDWVWRGWLTWAPPPQSSSESPTMIPSGPRM